MADLVANDNLKLAEKMAEGLKKLDAARPRPGDLITADYMGLMGDLIAGLHERLINVEQKWAETEKAPTTPTNSTTPTDPTIPPVRESELAPVLTAAIYAKTEAGAYAIQLTGKNLGSVTQILIDGKKIEATSEKVTETAITFLIVPVLRQIATPREVTVISKFGEDSRKLTVASLKNEKLKDLLERER